MNCAQGVKTLRYCLLLTTAMGCLAAPGAAFAQAFETSEDSERPSDTITVIARKQAESVQDVPVTVTAITGETLEKFQIDRVDDIVGRVPTFNVQVGGSGSGGQLSLRGVGSSNISAAFDSAVAFDFDGVQASSMRLVQAGFVDVEQIDVLKGPQSLFFGKSASAGVLAIRSANPTPTWEFGAKASYEFEEEGYLLNGFVSGPLTETLGIRIAAQYNDIEKYIELEPGTPAVNPSRGLEDFIGRVTLQWDPTDRFNANLKFNYAKQESDGGIQRADLYCGANGRADEVVLPAFGLAIPSNGSCDIDDGLYPTADPAPALVAQYPADSGAGGGYPGAPFGETDIYFTRLTMDYELTDNMTVSSVTGYTDFSSVDFDSYSYVGVGPAFILDGVTPLEAVVPLLAATNAPGSASAIGLGDPINEWDQLSQELRIASNFDGRFNFMLGGFYEKRNIDFSTSQTVVHMGLITPDPVTGNSVDWFKKHHTETDTFSVFGSVTFEVTDRLEISGGVRYTKEDKVNTIDIPYVHAFLSADPAFVSSGFNSGPIEFEDDNVSPEVSVRYAATDNVNIYAAYKTGFKSGGIDNSALPTFSLLGFGSNDPAVREATAQALIFQSETSEGGEAGVKATLLDGTLTLNSSIYYYVFDDLQVQNFDATSIQFLTLNVSQLTTQGLDVDFAWNTPIEGLNLSGSLAYTDAEFSAPFVGTTGDDLNGRKAARAPEFAGNFAFDYVRPLGRSYELELNANLQFSDEYFTDSATLNDYVQEAYVTVDGAIALSNTDAGWTLSLVGVNLTDELWANTGGGRPFLAGPGLGLPVGDDLMLDQNRGRQLFLEAKIRY